MISLKFSDFYKSNYDDIDYELYFVKDSGGKALYIGISSNSIWYRWFGSTISHMTISGNGGLQGSSHIGQVIERNFPDSWDWTIELWTKRDCLENLKEFHQDEGRVKIKDLESEMIQKYLPLYNVAHGGGYHEDPSSRKRLDDEYRKIFGGKKLP